MISEAEQKNNTKSIRSKRHPKSAMEGFKVPSPVREEGGKITDLATRKGRLDIRVSPFSIAKLRNF